MNSIKSAFKSAFIVLCTCVFFFAHADEFGQRLTQSLSAMSDHELSVFSLRWHDGLYGRTTYYPAPETTEMIKLTKKEIYARISRDGQDKFLKIFAPILQAHLSNILSNKDLAPHFLDAFHEYSRGIYPNESNLPEAYRNILKEFFFVHFEKIAEHVGYARPSSNLDFGRLMRFAQDNEELLIKFSYFNARLNRMIDYVENFEAFETLFQPRRIMQDPCVGNARDILSRG